MKQIKEIVMDGTLESLKDKMLSYQQHKGKSPIGFDLKEYQDLKKKLREEVFQILGLASPKNTLIITGHQPDFQHPGIIFKDLLAWKLAVISDSTVLHLIVDTDRFEVNYHYPVKLEEKYASTRKVFIGGRDYGIFKNTKMNERDRERFNSVMEESYENLKYFVSENCLLESEAYTKRILSACHKIVPLQFVLSEIKQDFYKSRGIHIHNLPVSKLVELEAFQIFAKKVCERRSEFNKIFNFHLASYREVHKIKNKAQPLPNLEENEYPFWVYDKSVAKRFPMKSYPASLPILPRAITLTMFVRLFLSDLFIHGTGGGRYEAVSDKVINDFFQMEASPYSVATATMHLNENENPENGFMDRRTIEGKLRDFRFSPDRFLEAENPLYLKKRELIAQWSNPNSDRKKLHQETKNLNSIIRQSISSVKEELELRKTKLPIILQTKEALRTRSFPFYYYDMQELIDHINQLQQE